LVRSDESRFIVRRIEPGCFAKLLAPRGNGFCGAPKDAAKKSVAERIVSKKTLALKKAAAPEKTVVSKSSGASKKAATAMPGVRLFCRKLAGDENERDASSLGVASFVTFVSEITHHHATRCRHDALCPEVAR
jgi:hypothetical protein